MDFFDTKFSKMLPVDAIREMLDVGYRQISRKHREVSRLDISVGQMKKKFIEENFGSTKGGLPSCSTESQIDYYRRCCSEDIISNVPESVISGLR